MPTDDKNMSLVVSSCISCIYVEKNGGLSIRVLRRINTLISKTRQFVSKSEREPHSKGDLLDECPFKNWRCQ